MTIHNLAFLLPLMVLWFFFDSSSALKNNDIVSNKLINGICKETRNPEFCKLALQNKGRARNMNELGIHSILSVRGQARLNTYAVRLLLLDKKDPITKSNLSKCLTDYEVTLDKLHLAYRLFDRKDYKGIIKVVNDARKMARI